MAIFLRNAVSEQSAVFCMDKTKDKQFYAKGVFLQTITQSGVSSVATANRIISFVLNGQKVVIKQMSVFKKIMFVSSDGIIFNDVFSMGLFYPFSFDYAHVGLGDVNPATVTNETEYMQRMHLVFPLKHNENIDSPDKYNFNHEFEIVNNRTYLTLFFQSQLSSSDHTNFIADFNAFIAARGGVSTLTSFRIEISFFVSGWCH